MSDNNQTTLLPYLLLQGASLPEWQNRTDAELLTEYARQGSELAFAALVHRHGPMVWRICWHRLRHYQDAEDAFQATFLVLARRAADIRPPEMLANWLYGVARQTAHKASLMAARRRHKETSLTQQTDSAAAAVKPEEECLLDCLYEEVAHLPEKFRAVVVLCDLEGLSRKEAGRQLGVPEGTVAGWLARARQLLHKRLARRGITLSLAAGLATLQANASAAPYRAVLASVRVASLLKAGESLAAAVPAKGDHTGTCGDAEPFDRFACGNAGWNHYPLAGPCLVAGMEQLPRATVFSPGSSSLRFRRIIRLADIISSHV
jgi:RNA polymerase sigma factor (sigma-70 family)